MRVRLLEFAVGATGSGLLVYGALPLVAWTIWRQELHVGLLFVGASGVFLAGWYSRRDLAGSMLSGRQISKNLARARHGGSLVYGAVLGAGVLTIVSTPAVWLGLACCLAVGEPLWGATYGLAFGAGRALMLLTDAHHSRGTEAVNAAFLVMKRAIDPGSRFRFLGVFGGLALVGLATAALFVAPAQI